MWLIELLLKGKTAVITGCNRGIGKAILERTAGSGANVFAVVRKETDEFAEYCAALSAEHSVEIQIVCADFENEDQVKDAAKQILRTKKPVDILVNNAGINRNHTSQDFPAEDWDEIRRVNYDAVFLMSQLAADVMREQKYGRIINMASLLSVIGGRMSLGYAAAKGGVVQMSKAMSNDWAPYGITVNCIAPGYMNTDMNKDYCADLSRSGHLLARIPVGRWGISEDLQAASVFLASEEAAYVTGILLPVDGGFLAW